MKVKRDLGSLIVALLAMAAAPRVEAATPSQVTLLYARNAYAFGPDGTGYYAYGYAEVQNLGYAKKVSAVYRVSGGAWIEAAGTYVAPTRDGFEAWKFATRLDNPPAQGQALSWEIAVKYEVNGQTYWDNNTGQNYQLSTSGVGAVPREVLHGSAVVLNTASASTASSGGVVTRKSVGGQVFVQNLAYAKSVQIAYTTDGWSTVQYADATYVGVEYPGVENWGFVLDVPTSTTSVSFAVKYVVNGQTYWDNNFTSNYTLGF